MLFAINAAGDVVSYFIVHDALRSAAGAMVSSIFLFLLLRRKVRNYFFRQALLPSHKR